MIAAKDRWRSYSITGVDRAAADTIEDTCGHLTWPRSRQASSKSACASHPLLSRHGHRRPTHHLQLHLHAAFKNCQQMPANAILTATANLLESSRTC